jgi:hypothetical protein
LIRLAFDKIIADLADPVSACEAALFAATVVWTNPSLIVMIVVVVAASFSVGGLRAGVRFLLICSIMLGRRVSGRERWLVLSLV